MKKIEKLLIPLVNNKSNPYFRYYAGADGSDELGNTALHQAVRLDDPEVIRHLMNTHQFDLEALNAFGQTPLAFAVTRNCVDAVRCLLELGASVRAGEREHGSLLAFAVSQSNREVLSCLLEHGADPDEPIVGQSGIQDYLLHWTAERGRADILEVILKTSTLRINQINGAGQSPLHVTAKRFASSSTFTDEDLNRNLELLLEYGADPLLQNTEGRYFFEGIRSQEVRLAWEQRTMEYATQVGPVTNQEQAGLSL